MYEVTFFPVLAAGIVNLFVGYAWYHPRVFGGIWMRLSHITPESVEQGKRRMFFTVPLALLASMLVAYVMNYFGIAWGVFDWVGAVELGFWCWVGFVAPVSLGMVLWEQKPVTLYLLNALYWLVAFVAIAITLVIL